MADSRWEQPGVVAHPEPSLLKAAGESLWQTTRHRPGHQPDNWSASRNEPLRILSEPRREQGILHVAILIEPAGLSFHIPRQPTADRPRFTGESGSPCPSVHDGGVGTANACCVVGWDGTTALPAAAAVRAWRDLVGFEGDVVAAYHGKGAAAALEAAGKLVGQRPAQPGSPYGHASGGKPCPGWRPTGDARRADVLQTVQRLTGRPGIAYANRTGWSIADTEIRAFRNLGHA